MPPTMAPSIDRDWFKQLHAEAQRINERIEFEIVELSDEHRKTKGKVKARDLNRGLIIAWLLHLFDRY